jgi:hypothetical protein
VACPVEECAFLLSVKVVVLAFNLVQSFFTFTDGLIILPSKSDIAKKPVLLLPLIKPIVY